MRSAAYKLFNIICKVENLKESYLEIRQLTNWGKVIFYKEAQGATLSVQKFNMEIISWINNKNDRWQVNMATKYFALNWL